MNDALKKVLEALGIADDGLIDEIKERAAGLPVEERVAAIEALIREKVSPEIDPAKLAATITGIARDVMTGVTEIDPDAWAGGV
ncbi:MAG TPA: hypothetical protein VJY35_15515 [Candidatus Eisenbacteria bacterium]|nr:hypothetical protein [Candidatus Eisenbacteria bacterium]